MQHRQTTVIHFAPPDIGISPHEAARYFGGSRFKPDKRHGKEISAAMGRAGDIIRPVCAYAVHPLKHVDAEGSLFLQDGTTLKGPANVGNVTPRHMAACVCTLGHGIDKAIAGLGREKDVYQSTLLDAVAVAFLDTLAEKAGEVIGAQAQRKRMHTGCRFGPGYGNMSLTQQSALFQMVDAAAIGVRCNDSMVMVPFKSLSFFLVLSTRPQSTTPNKCTQCRLAGCRFRAAE